MRELTPEEQALHDREREIFRLQEELDELRRSLPPSPIEDFELEGPEGPVRLSDLFGEKDDLIVIHNMGRSCPYCTLWADGLNGVVAHMEDRAALVLCSPDPPAVQQAFARSRGWRFRMVSDGGGFTHSMGFAEPADGGRTAYAPGFSTFRRTPEGSIERIGWAWFGPGDTFAPIWHLFGALAQGADGWQPKFDYPTRESGRPLS